MAIIIVLNRNMIKILQLCLVAAVVGVARACVPFGGACTDYWGAEACCGEGSGVMCVTPMDNSQATCQTCLNRGDECGADSHCCTGCCHDGECRTYDAFCLSSGSISF